MKKIIKVLLWFAAALFITPVALYFILLIGNLKNEELNPELAALLAHRPSQIKEKDNAYFDMIGLAAPSTMEPHAWGLSWFNQVNANDRIILENLPALPIKLDGYPLDSHLTELPCTQKNTKQTCIEEVALNPSAALKILKNESDLLHRFDAQLGKNYQEPYREMSFMSEFAPFAPQFRASRLAQIRIALEISQGHDEVALARWKSETAIILRQASNSHTLISKMVLIASLNRYQKLLAEYISWKPAVARFKAKQLISMLEPFDKSCITLQPAFESETIFSTRSMLSPQLLLVPDTEEDSPIIKKIFYSLFRYMYDRNATANEIATKHLEISRIVALEGDAYRTAIAKMAAHQSKLNDEGFTFHYHNPVGNILLDIGGGIDYTTYLYKSDNIIANKKLLVFAIDLLSRNIISTKKITDEIIAREADLKHPYTGELPVWDEKSRILSYAKPALIKRLNLEPLFIKL